MLRSATNSTTFQKFVRSRGWFRSTDLWVMGPARFLCATLLKATRQKWKSYSYSYSGTSLLDSIGCEYGPACLSECCAFVAQWLEHWSCKPGVESSNLSEGFCKIFKTAHVFRLWLVRLCGFIVASDRIRYHIHHIRHSVVWGEGGIG